MERKLLLLGLLRIQEMYGYLLNDVIDSHLGLSVHLTKPTVYDLLRKMAIDGWITHRDEQEGNRPPRRVYAITAEGEAAFQKMLRDSLSAYEPAEFHSDVSVAFLDAIPPNEALPLLQQRRAVIAELLESASEYEHHPGSFQLIIEHQIRHLTNELAWADELIQQIEAAKD